MNNPLSRVVEYYNNTVHNGQLNEDPIILGWLKRYLHSSHGYHFKKDGIDKWNVRQPTLTDNIDVEYCFAYTDDTQKFNHKSNRINIKLKNGDFIDISVHKFKQFLRNKCYRNF